MCLRLCLVAHALCGVAYTSAGSVLMVAGVFFFISSPLLQLGSNMLTGGLCIVFGVGSVILTCCGGRELDASRVDKLLGCSLFILVACVANLVVLEVGEWWLFYNDNLKDIIEMHQMEQLAFYGHLVPSITTCAVMAVAFLDTQFLYCTYNLGKTPRARQLRINETVSDIEYIIPRHNTRLISSKQAPSLTQYTQSWVFDTEGSSQTESPYLKVAQGGSSSDVLPRRHQPPSPVVSVQVESAPEDSPEVGRQLLYMKSFSRTHSRAHSPADGDTSDFSTSTSVSLTQPPIYECLERLTQPSVHKSRLGNYITASESERPNNARHVYLRQTSRETNEAKTHATLIAELGRSISNKQPADLQSRSSDTDFSVELEAALKLIQDLESPNTIDTPSETNRGLLGMKGDEECGSGGSSKTLSGRSSLDGKQTCDLPVESQSTSGYNSPSMSERATPVSDVPDGGVSCVIRNIGPTALISIFRSGVKGAVSAPSSPSPALIASSFSTKRRSHVRTLSAGDAKFKDEGRLKLALGRVRGILSQRRPSLLPDLERAVLKSESLAFLSDGELEDRLEQTRDIHRRIEAKVKREMLIRRWESYGSVEDIMNEKLLTQF